MITLRPLESLLRPEDLIDTELISMCENCKGMGGYLKNRNAKTPFL